MYALKELISTSQLSIGHLLGDSKVRKVRTSHHLELLLQADHTMMLVLAADQTTAVLHLHNLPTQSPTLSSAQG